MQLSELIEALSQPAAYPGADGPVEVIHTHISVVFLVGQAVYKIRKPVTLDFLDFSTFEQRRHDCEEEVRLNRRLAPQVYVGVVPVARDATGVRVGGSGEVVEWAVQMHRLPESARLDERIRAGAVTPATMEQLARTLARFHAEAEGGPEVARLAYFDGVARNLRDNVMLPAGHIGARVSQTVLDRVRDLMNERLERHRALIDARADRGVPRDCHGDLHLDHIYLFPDRAPPDDLAMVDCIEFNQRFRFIDPVADIAFLDMDLRFHGYEELAAAFREAYFVAANDAEGAALLPLYIAYRAAVRGKVEGLKADEAEVPAPERARAREKAQAHWQLALAALEQPDRRPAMVLVAGLPGTGKSTLARALAQPGDIVLRSDEVRKEMARAEGFVGNIYTPEWAERTYRECLRRAEEGIFEGNRVFVDANCGRDEYRRRFHESAQRMGVPSVLLHCIAPSEVVKARLENRRGDVSDADWSIHQQAAKRWQDFSDFTRRFRREIATDANAVTEARAVLAEMKLA